MSMSMTKMTASTSKFFWSETIAIKKPAKAGFLIAILFWKPILISGKLQLLTVGLSIRIPNFGFADLDPQQHQVWLF